MKEETISRTQLVSLLWAGVMAPAAELLPGLNLPLAGRGAWLSVLAAAPLVLLSGYLFGRLTGTRGLAHCVQGLLGPVLGGLVLFVYGAWALGLLMLRLRLCAERLLSAGDGDGSVWFFLLIIGGLVLWMGLGRLTAFARAAQFFLAILLAVSVAVLGLSVFKVRLAWLLPLWWQDAQRIASTAMPTAGVLGWGLYTAFLATPEAGEERRNRWHWVFWGLGGCVLLTAAQMIILGNFGTSLAATLDNPFFSLAKSVGVEGAFQRVEGAVSALWTFADLVMAMILLFALRSIAGVIVPKLSSTIVVAASVAAALAAALIAVPGTAVVEHWSRTIVPAVNITLGLAIPTLLCCFQLAKKGRTRDRGDNSISCVTDPP